ncbi:poly-gamma-glutamate synthesis protein (capsule biosynthesis protein) [Nitrosococcus halophilus Nc 4]|uniref:Poly-gamma-glutamate synthesis protein (Capsule biosynthesis protein) n=1 Tax=Nitrosococcus halophilus (strain Nc4) TaxID=472759 RepID=D5C1L2_NITHN|nr:CapA family protein [Nitrosococcus halophilus]ADE14645.1 poly-gamma-glutamate synthesis protein (capsule biosynthesis protein) [Nitrosococcus halophilus Nc 4]
MEPAEPKSQENSNLITLFLCGDVMTGRGIDQILPYSNHPAIHEPYMDMATDYVKLAEKVNGPIPKPVDFAYIWGDALEELALASPDIRIINLETSITTSDDWLPKGINYRMHPKNISCITAAEIDCCVLANNHVLDWGYSGLAETLETLKKAGINTAGAGDNLNQAKASAIMEVSGKGRVVVFSYGSVTSGIPLDWAASKHKAGVNLLADFSEKTACGIGESVREVKQPGDIVIASIHWGGNWGYYIPPEQRAFAHQLIEEAGVNIIHGHSPHHAKGIEIYKGSPILYGCGDFLNDYEGIRGYEKYRGELTLMYFVTMEAATGKVCRLEMVPLQIKRFSLKRALREDRQWLQETLTREGKKLGTRVEGGRNNTLILKWE